MKIIFLDIDGVLNNRVTFRTRTKDNETLHDYLDSLLSEELILNLQRIVDKTKAKVVLSSTWRLSHYHYTVNKLKLYGIEIIDRTPRFVEPYVVRGNEILAWLKENEKLIDSEYYNYEKYVILDDSSDMLYWQKDNYIQVNGELGLTKDDVILAIEILNKGE